MNKFFKAVSVACACLVSVVNVAAKVPELNVDGRSACIMEKSTGKILFVQNEDERLPLASVTKIMTMILIYDAVKSGKINWDSKVTVSEHAASMGGSQIFLEPNEVQDVSTLTKSIAIASANDAAVAMAEFIGGSVEEFVNMMNEKAKELGMENTHFVNACGLDTDGHYSSAEDIALMSVYLLKNYPDVTKFTTTWQDEIVHSTKKGDSNFTLTNTNKLIKWYNGATGLKTGSTSKAMYCLSGSAKRDNMEVVAVIMGAKEPKARFREVMKMLDYSFANYCVTDGEDSGRNVGSIAVYNGMKDEVQLCVKDKVSFVREKGNNVEITKKIIPEAGITAPFEKGVKAGEIVYYCGNEEVGRSALVTCEGVEKADLYHNILKLIPLWF